MAAILIIWQLFVPPALSVADDNDFQKLAGRYCLGQTRGPSGEKELFDYTNLRWQYSTEACAAWPFRTTAEGAVSVALKLNSLVNSAASFDLRFLGVVYGMLFLAGFLRLQQALREAPLTLDRAIQSAFLLMTCNAVYIPLLNTFYFDAAALAAITGAIVGVSLVALGRRVSAPELLWAAVWLGIVAGSKSQHAVTGIFTLVFWVRRGRAAFPPIWTRSLATAAVAAALAFSVSTTSEEGRANVTFNALFFRILPDTARPERYLAETRIPGSWLKYSGQHAFTPGGAFTNPANRAGFRTWFGLTDLTRLYIRHPNAAFIIFRVNLEEGSRDRVRMRAGGVDYRLGNYERAVATKPQQISRFFCLMPRLKYLVIGGRPWIYLLYICGAVLALWALAPALPGLRFLLAIGTLCLALMWFATMLDGADGGRHLTIFNFLIDVVVSVDLGLLFTRLWNRVRPTTALRGSAGSRA